MKGKFTKNRLTRLFKDEKGMALIIVLVFLLLGSITIIPVLAHINTALESGREYEEDSNELYTADSGIEESLWRIKYDFMGVDYDAYDFSSTWPYETDSLNGETATFTVKNVWFPCNVAAPAPAAARAIIESEKLVVAGTSGAVIGEPYSVKLDFTPDPGDNLMIKSLGVWLPDGFDYVANSCSLQFDGPFEDYYPDNIDVADAPGGSTVVWSYNPPYPLFTDFPDVDLEAPMMSLTFTFAYTPPAEHPDQLPVAIAWTTTDMTVGEFGFTNPNDVPVSWDTDTRFYEVISTSGETTVQAFTSKCELRQMGDAMSGDYVAIGGSLLSDDNHDNLRETWHTPSSYNLDTIPEDADVVAAYLYWAGWRNEASKVTVLQDNCSDFDNWDRDAGGGSPTRVPTGDGDTYNTWDYSPCWDDVDETTPNDGDYMTGTTNGGGYKLFTFAPFSIPAGSSITNLTIYFRARDWGSGGSNNNIRPSIKVDGTRYNTTASSNNPGTSWTTYSYSYTENPDTGSAWTAEDLNGTGSHPLQQFGVYSSDLRPDIQVSMVYAEVTYTESLWSISSGRFQGQGAGSATDDQRTLTLKNSLDLSGYAPGSVSISWDQDESGTLETVDTLYFAFSGDGGSTWSGNIEAFHDDDPSSPFMYTIPEPYSTSSNFKIRFYLDFDDTSEYAYLDNIEVINLPLDTEVTFKIDGNQVYFNGSTPTIGPNPLVAGRSYVMLNTMWGSPEGFSYACTRDVTALVRAFADEGDPGHYPGNALYTVDGVAANTGSNFSFSGWSLIVVYASPETAGHYIYIRDDNFAFHPGDDQFLSLDFDMDGNPGGDITNFVVPEPIKDQYGTVIETVAAKLTCFVAEGDNFGTSSVKITGQQSGLSKDLSNPQSPVTDVWNGKSYPGTYQEGVDIDTFEVLWTDNILTPDDNVLHVDLYSYNDAWNLVYFIISVRSETVTGGTSYYVIYG